jgi:hypothetical protein
MDLDASAPLKEDGSSAIEISQKTLTLTLTPKGSVSACFFLLLVPIG